MTGRVSAFLGQAGIDLHSIQPPAKFTSGIPRPVMGDSIAQASNDASLFISTAFELASDMLALAYL
jgi:hypothetical protein